MFGLVLRAPVTLAILPIPQSNVSTLVAERGGISLMEEQGTKPVNQYLPPRQKTLADMAAKNSSFQGGCGTALEAEAKDAPGFFGWLDKALDTL